MDERLRTHAVERPASPITRARTVFAQTWAAVRHAWHETPRAFRAPVVTVWRAARWYSQDQASIYAAAIAYYALFSLVPLAVLTLSILGLVLPPQRVVDFVLTQLPLEQTSDVEENVRRIVRQARDLSPAGLGIGVIGLLWSASGVFSAVRRGLNATSHRTKSRPYWHEKLVDFALVPALAILIALSIALTALAQVIVAQVEELGPIPVPTSDLARWASILAAAAVSFAMFTLLYRFVPSSRPEWKEALAGAACATVLFEATKNAAAYVLSFAAVGENASLYAGFGTAMVFLFWVMLNASIMLFGAEFGRAVGATVSELRDQPAQADAAID